MGKFDLINGAMSSTQEQFLESLEKGDFVKAAQLLKEGANINAFDKIGNTPLQHVIFITDDAAQRLEAVKFLLKHGADPNTFDADDGGPLVDAVHWQDEKVISILLENGANPNIISEGESTYDYAEFDYRYETWDGNMPVRPTDADRETEETWLAFLDRIAIKYKKRRPDYLFMLRNAGAKTTKELQTFS